MRLRPRSASAAQLATSAEDDGRSGRGDDSVHPAAAARERFGRTSEWLVNLSTVAFLGLTLPQILKNAANISAGAGSALSVLPWTGYAASLVGNMLMLSYFVREEERAGAGVQVVGVLGNAAVLTQICVAGHMPAPLLVAVLCATSLGLAINVSALLGGREAQGRSGGAQWMQAVQGAWYAAAVLGGATTLPAVLLRACLDGGASAAATAAAAATACALALAARRRAVVSLADGSSGSAQLGSAWVGVGAWVATLHFMVLGVSQIAQNLRSPEALAGLSVSSVLIGAVGNALMMPRALFLRDRVWLLGSTWGAVVSGWGCLMSVYLLGGVSGAFITAVTLALCVHLAAIAAAECRSTSVAHAHA